MLDSLTRIEQQLLVAGQRDIARHRNRRRIALPSYAIVGLLVAASGASAVTGVGPIANLLDGEPSFIDPVIGDNQATITVKDSGGTERTALVFRRGANGPYCVQAPPARDRTLSSGACTGAQEVQAQFDAHKAFVTTASVKDGNKTVPLVAGIIPANATAVTVSNSDGTNATHATVTDVWTKDTSSTGQYVAARGFLSVLATDLDPTRATVTVTTPSGSSNTRLPDDLLGP